MRQREGEGEIGARTERQGHTAKQTATQTVTMQGGIRQAETDQRQRDREKATERQRETDREAEADIQRETERERIQHLSCGLDSVIAHVRLEWHLMDVRSRLTVVVAAAAVGACKLLLVREEGIESKAHGDQNPGNDDIPQTQNTILERRQRNREYQFSRSLKRLRIT